MSQLLQEKQSSPVGMKQISDEQINECMEFCAMYNILHAIHNFKIPLKNVDEKKRVKTTKLNSKAENTKVISTLRNNNKQPSKKGSKFQKPKGMKKKQPYEKEMTFEQPSQVDNYNHQQKDYQLTTATATSRLYQQPVQSLSSSRNNKPITKRLSGGQRQVYQKQDNDLSKLISNLAVGNNTIDQPSMMSKRNSVQRQSATFSQYYMNSPSAVVDEQMTNSMDKSQYGSKYYGNGQMEVDYKDTPNYYSYTNSNNYNNNPSSLQVKGLSSQNTSINNNMNNNYSQYMLNGNNGNYNQQPYQYGGQVPSNSKSNPYSKANYQGYNNFDLSQFYAHHNQQQQQQLYKNPSQQCTQLSTSPYASQLFNLESYYMGTNKSPQANYVTRNLFHQQSSPLFTNTDHSLKYNNNPYGQQQKKTNKYIDQVQLQNMAEKSNYMQWKNQQQQLQNEGKNISSKALTPRSTNRSVSPMGTSSSCRNFFIKSPRDLSADDMSQTSRSKSRRKQRPGGSKSFYQPSLSGRKVISKQKQQPTQQQQQYEKYITNEEPQYYYQNQQQVYQQNSQGQYEAPYFKQQQQQQQKTMKSYQQKNTKQYPNRMTRETDISAVSSWDQKGYPQKTTKSQQVIVEQQQQYKKHQGKNKNVQKNIYEQKGGNVNSKKGKRQSQQSHSEHSSQGQDVQLDNIDDEMQQLSNSGKKIPLPIKIDMTNKQHATKKYKK